MGARAPVNVTTSKDSNDFDADIDESGDQGFTRLGWRAQGVESASTEWLILGAVVVPAEVDAERTAIVAELRQVVNRTASRKSLHWRNLREPDESRSRRGEMAQSLGHAGADYRAALL